MKKLMFAAVAGLSLASFAAIESSNIVGYNTNDKTGKQYNVLGYGFVSVDSADKTFKLSEIKPVVWSSSSDILQYMSPENARTLISWVYLSAQEASDNGLTEEYVGWWDPSYETKYTGTGAVGDGDVVFDLGTGFKSNIAAKDAKINNSGKVNMEATEVDYSGKQYVALANILPQDIKLGHIVGIGTESSSDIVQLLSTENARTESTYVYLSAAEAAANGLGSEYVGWWNVDMTEQVNEVPLKAGDAFWCNLANKTARFAFPAAGTITE